MTEKKKQGFSAMSKEKQEEARAKSRATRAANKLKREQTIEKAAKLRQQAQALQDKVEKLLQEADSLDGQVSSEKIKKKREAELCEEIDTLYRGTVSDQYLKTMKQYAIMRNISASSLVTPTHVAMDILHDPRATVKDKENAAKTLQQFENAKPMMKEDAEGEILGSAQEEFDSLMMKLADSAPKR